MCFSFCFMPIKLVLEISFQLNRLCFVFCLCIEINFHFHNKADFPLKRQKQKVEEKESIFQENISKLVYENETTYG